MKTLLIIVVFTFFSTTDSVYQFKPLSIDGKAIDLSKYKGKKILIVNTASECGYTKQYAELEKLYQQYKNKLVVIGFPANNFGGQEPGTDKEIAGFCSKTYNVTFPMAAKVSVKGSDINKLFSWLTLQPNPDFTGEIKWNFEKFLLDENGKVIHRFRSRTQPMDEAIIQALK